MNCTAHGSSTSLSEMAEKQGATQRGSVLKQTRKFLRCFVRGFRNGVIAYSGFQTLSILTSRSLPRGLRLIWSRVFSWDCARFATFLGLYPSVYQLLVKQLKKYRKKRDGWAYGLAGGIAGLSIVIENESRRRFVTLNVIARAAATGLHSLLTLGYIPRVPHFDIMVFSLCSGLILYLAVMKTSLIQKSYYETMMKWSRDFTPDILDVLFHQSNDHYVTCQEVGLHQQSCTVHALKDFFKSVLPFAKLNAPIFVIPAVLFRRKAIKERPKDTAVSLVKSIIRSGIFLASVTALAKYTLCQLRNFTRKPPPVPSSFLLISGMVGGLGVAVENKSRRQEQILFTIPHLLSALYNLDAKSVPQKRMFNRVPFGTVTLFCLCMMVLTHAYERQPETLSPVIKGVLGFFLGRKSVNSSRTKES